MSDPKRAKRVLANEQLFETVNEAIADVNARLGLDVETDLYLCECSAPDCTERIALTHAEYAEARREPTRFFMIAGHRDPAHERVVRETDRYILVEKA